MPDPDRPVPVPIDLGPPSLVFQGHRWPADELTRIAAHWLEPLRDDDAPLVAVVMANHPQSIAAFFAACGGSRPVIVLPPSPAAWRTEPALPPGTRILLPPALGELAPPGRALGLEVAVLAEPTTTPSRSPCRFTAPGLVLFTSGSTGAPKPVYRTTSQVLGSVTRILEVVGAPRGVAIAGTLPLSTTHGISAVLAAAERAGTLGLLERFEPATALALFASGDFHYWPAVPVMAEMLARLAARRPSSRWRVPPMCTVAGAPLPEPVWHAFREQFGVPLRAIYGSTEVGMVTIESAPAREVRPGTVGLAARDVDIRIGEDPRAPVSADVPGRIWVRSPLAMEGYGYPPRLARPDAIDGWRPMADHGRLSDDGYLTIVGRTDEAFKTRGGYLVEPEAIAAALRACPGVSAVVVVPVPTRAGVVAGALVESPAALQASDLRARLEATLPSWSRPGVVHVVSALPRLDTGKVDRLRCAAILGRISRPPSP